MKHPLSIAAVAALVLSSGMASAQNPSPGAQAGTPRVDARQARQDQRIEQGVASGQLTARETRRLEREQQRIARVEARAKADGQVTPQERKHLHHLQDHASRDIRHQKHDAQVRAPGAAGR